MRQRDPFSMMSLGHQQLRPSARYLNYNNDRGESQQQQLQQHSYPANNRLSHQHCAGDEYSPRSKVAFGDKFS